MVMRAAQGSTRKDGFTARPAAALLCGGQGEDMKAKDRVFVGTPQEAPETERAEASPPIQFDKQEVIAPTAGLYIWEQWDQNLVIETPAFEDLAAQRLMLSWDEVRALNLALAKRLEARDRLIRKREQMAPSKII